MSLISFNNVSFYYTKCKPVLEEVSFSAKKGEIVGILGVNGCGKSTILNLMSGLLKPIGGQVLFLEKDLALYKEIEIAQKISYVRQINMFIPDYYTVQEFVQEGRRPFAKLGMYSKKDIRLCDEALSIFDLESFKQRRVASLSGGERQRVILARAFCKEASIYLLDEPTSAMDISAQKNFFETLKIIRKKSNPLVMITLHTITEAIQNCDKLVVLDNHKVYYFGDSQNIDDSVLSKVYRVELGKFVINGKPYFYW